MWKYENVEMKKIALYGYDITKSDVRHFLVQ